MVGCPPSSAVVEGCQVPRASLEVVGAGPQILAHQVGAVDHRPFPEAAAALVARPGRVADHRPSPEAAAALPALPAQTGL